MNQKTHIKVIFTLLILVFLCPSHAKKLYRWVDENNNVSFSDKVPPKYSQREQTQLNDKGRVIAVRDAAKTPEQVSQLKKIRSLQAVKKSLLEKQQKKDSVLMRTFQSEAMIDRALNSKLNMLNIQIAVTKKQTDTLLKQLLLYQKNAADFERRGKTLSKKSQDNIRSAKNQYENNQSRVIELSDDKQALIATFEQDKNRFFLLQDLNQSNISVNTSNHPSLALGEISCHHTSTCNTLWKKALAFTKDHAATEVIFESNDLLLTADPRSDKDISLSLTKKKHLQETTLFLDMACKNTKMGKITCKKNNTVQLVEQFKLLQKSL